MYKPKNFNIESLKRQCDDIIDQTYCESERLILVANNSVGEDYSEYSRPQADYYFHDVIISSNS